MDSDDYDTQTALITSEQRRLHLEQELKKLMGQSNRSERLREIQLRTQMENLTAQRQKSMERNRMIRRQMHEFEVNLSAVSAKTHRLRTLKVEYEEYIERLYPKWKEQVLAKAAEQKEKEARRQAMRRDVGMTDELSVPDLSRSQSEGFSPHHSLRTDSQNGSRVPHPGYYDYSATGPQATDTQSQQLYYGNGAAGDHSSGPGSSQGGSVYPQPHRSSTPDHSVPRQDRGLVSTSLQSLHSEKSVTFDESSLRRELGPSSQTQASPTLTRLSPRDLHVTQPSKQRISPRRQTPSPSELIRMSMDSKNSSRHSSQNSLLDFDSRQPTQSQSIKPTFDQSQTSFNMTGQSTYPDFSQSHPDIGRPPISQPATSQTIPNTGDLKPATTEPVYAVVQKSPQQSSQSVPSPGAASVTSAVAPVTTSVTAAVTSSAAPVGDVTAPVTQERRFSGAQVVIPSTEDVVDDVESLQDIHVYDKPDGDRLHQQPHSDESSPAHRPPPAAAVMSQQDVPDVRHSLSSLNTTTEEPQPTVDPTKTAEFKNLLMGTMSSTQNMADDDDDSDSEDSMAKIERQYQQLALSKTNTIPVGQHLAPPPADLLPSSDEETDETDSISQPMGYTPSFQTNTVKQSVADSTQPPTTAGHDTSTAVGGLTNNSAGGLTNSAGGLTNNSAGGLNASTGGMSGAGTGGSKSSQSSRKPVFDSDVESESDFQNGSTNKKSAAADGSDLEDDFDFYG